MKAARALTHDLEAVEDIHRQRPLDLETLILRYDEARTQVTGSQEDFKIGFLALVGRLFGAKTANSVERRLETSDRRLLVECRSLVKSHALEQRTETVREPVQTTLRAGAATAHALSALVGERDIPGHLAHLARSLGHRGERLIVLPATCIACGFAFENRERLTRPGACPKCQTPGSILPRSSSSLSFPFRNARTPRARVNDDPGIPRSRAG